MCKCENVQIYNNAFNYSFYNYKAFICTFTHFSRIFTFKHLHIQAFAHSLQFLFD